MSGDISAFEAGATINHTSNSVKVQKMGFYVRVVYGSVGAGVLTL